MVSQRRFEAPTDSGKHLRSGVAFDADTCVLRSFLRKAAPNPNAAVVVVDDNSCAIVVFVPLPQRAVDGAEESGQKQKWYEREGVGNRYRPALGNPTSRSR